MKKVLTTPLRDEELRALNTGDILYLSGTIVTGRDDVHHRVVKENLESPIALSGLAIFHAGPIVQRQDDGSYQMVAIGPTSSVRMNDEAPAFLEKTGVRMMLGKGGMNRAVSDACQRLGAVHCVFPGGCAVSAAQRVEAVEGVYWPELGMPESLWVLRVKEFGPLIVTIDTKGNNLFEDNKAHYQAKKAECMQPILEFVEDFMKVEPE